MFQALNLFSSIFVACFLVLRKILLFILLMTAPSFMGVAWSSDADDQGPLLTTEESAAIDAVLDQAIVLGFPEVRGSRWYESKYSFYGPVTLQLPVGGNWLEGCWNPLSRPTRETPATDAIKVMQQLTVLVRADFPWQILRVAPNELTRLQRSATISLGGALSESWPGWGGPSIPKIALPGAILRRCGHPEIGDRLLLQAQYQRTRAEYGLCFTIAECDRFGGYETPGQRWDERVLTPLWLPYERCDRWIAAEERLSATAPPIMNLIPLSTVLRRECHWWFRQRLIEAHGDTAPSLARAAITILDIEDRVRVADDIAQLVARAGIEEAPFAKASLAARLAAWDAGPFCSFSHNEFSSWDSHALLTPQEYQSRFLNDDALGRQKQRREYDQWRLFSTFADEIDGLVGLLGSTAPSRWLEDGTPRLLGDNALRALTVLWSVDPRLLVGRDRFALWNDAERTATAKAVEAFWHVQRGRGINDAIRANLIRVPLWSLQRLHERASHVDCGLLNKAIAVVRRDGPPVLRDRQEEEGWNELLAQLGPDPALAATIRAWPIHGPLARQVLLTHELAGDQAPLDAYLRRVLDGVITKEDEEIAKGGDTSTDLAIAMSRPNLVRVRMLTEIIKKGAASSLFTALVKEVVQTSEYMEKSKLVRKLFSRSREITPHTAHALFLWTLLDDQRLASPPLVTEVLRLTDLDKTTLASDLRVCDVVMARLGNQTISGESVNEDAKERAFHLSLTRGDRDTLIAKRRAVIQTMADSIAIELGLNAEDLHRLGMKEQASNF